MSEESDYERLMAKARNCRNNARAEQVVVDAFHDEYVAGLSNAENPPTPDMHRHMRETYDFYIGGQRRAKDFLADAALYERAATALFDVNSVRKSENQEV
jgi:hypothetical protein